MNTIILIVALISINAMADNCLSEIKFVGGKNNISASCFDFAPAASIYNHRLIEDEDLELKVWDRIVFAKNHKTGYLTRIAGGKTQLFKVKSIDYDSKNKILYVLNENELGEKSILSFLSKWQGNVFPYSTIGKEDLPQDIKQIVWDVASEQLLALAQSGKIIYALKPGESRHTDWKKRPRMEKSLTAKVPISYIHPSSSGLYLIYENLEWKKFDGLKDKKILKDGKVKDLKAPLKTSLL